MSSWTKFAVKGYFQLKKQKKSEHHHWILHIQISLVTKFYNFCFLDQICSKNSISGWIQKNWTSPLNSAYSNKSWYHISDQNNNFEFWTKFPQKEYFPVKNGKSEHSHWILQIRISLGIKFHLKLIILIFLTKFVHQGYFQSKTKEVNTAIEFYIIELVYVSSFTLNWQF